MARVVPKAVRIQRRMFRTVKLRLWHMEGGAPFFMASIEEMGVVEETRNRMEAEDKADVWSRGLDVSVGVVSDNRVLERHWRWRS